VVELHREVTIGYSPRCAVVRSASIATNHARAPSADEASRNQTAAPSAAAGAEPEIHRVDP
jgi:hypothetical protein